MASTVTFYNVFREAIGDGRVDMDNDVFKVALTTSTYTPDAEAHTAYTDLTNELNGNGYTLTGQTIATTTWLRTTSTVHFDGADSVWTASGGSITARYAVVYDDTASPKVLMAYWLLDSTPADVTASDGNTFTLAWDTSGIFTVT